MRSYEPKRNLITGITNAVNASLVSGFAYQNDALGRRVQRTDAGTANASNQFGYNDRSELTTAAMGTNNFGYAYDPIGNRTAATNNNGVATAYVSDALNQYTNITTSSTLSPPSYDLDGNMLQNSDFTYTWDAENRMISAGSSSVVVSNRYDYMSRRYQKIVGSTTSTFSYEGWNLVSEISNSPSEITTNLYTWGPDLSGSLQGAGGIGGLISITISSSSSAPTTYYPCFDANGNITDYVDANGTVVAHREYDAYGNTTVATGPLVHTLHFWFSTKHLDEETGLYYYGYRYYSPNLGRWISRDPIEEEGGANIYGYVLNRPTQLIDWLGEKDVPTDFRDHMLGEIHFLDPTDFFRTSKRLIKAAKKIMDIYKFLDDLIGNVVSTEILDRKEVPDCYIHHEVFEKYEYDKTRPDLDPEFEHGWALFSIRIWYWKYYTWKWTPDPSDPCCK